MLTSNRGLAVVSLIAAGFAATPAFAQEEDAANTSDCA